jgi:DHA1 family multidrug resistance protein-like MFS transporter
VDLGSVGRTGTRIHTVWLRCDSEELALGSLGGCLDVSAFGNPASLSAARNFKCKYSPSTGKAASQAYEQSTIEVSERNRSSKIKDPSILFIHVYTGLFYGIYYSFFECLPLIFPPDYHFNLVETGLAFLACGVGATLGQMIYFCYLKWYMIPDNLKNGLREQEHRLVPGAIAAWLLPVGLMVFAWTARPDIHWIVCLIGVVLFVIGFFIVMQALFVYLPLSYPKYAASLFTANDLLRSLNAFASVLYARPLFINLGVDKGVTLLGGLTCAGALGMIWLYFFGKKLRAMSSFAEG